MNASKQTIISFLLSQFEVHQILTSYNHHTNDLTTKSINRVDSSYIIFVDLKRQFSFDITFFVDEFKQKICLTYFELNDLDYCQDVITLDDFTHEFLKDLINRITGTSHIYI